MKFTSATAIALLAAAGLAAPVAEADAAAVAVANAEANPDFLSFLFGLGLGFNLFGLDVGADVSVSTGIYITPDNRLTYGCTVPGSVAFAGAVVNGDFYVKSPFIEDNNGCITIGEQDILEIQVSAEVDINLGWYPWGDCVYPNGRRLWACPDNYGNSYIYCNNNCNNAREINFQRQWW